MAEDDIPIDPALLALDLNANEPPIEDSDTDSGSSDSDDADEGLGEFSGVEDDVVR
jgi:hypothetical protein